MLYTFTFTSLALSNLNAMLVVPLLGLGNTPKDPSLSLFFSTERMVTNDQADCNTYLFASFCTNTTTVKSENSSTECSVVGLIMLAACPLAGKR